MPTGQSTHAFDTTLWFVGHIVASQLVSAKEASSPDAFVDPTGQGKHEFEETYSFTPQIVGVHSVLDSEARSPPA